MIFQRLYVQFSLPLPQGGRDAVTKNVILREDQLPQRVLHPKTRKKANKVICVFKYVYSWCYFPTRVWCSLFIYFLNHFEYLQTNWAT